MELVNNLAWLYLNQGRYADALPLTQRLIASGHAEPNVALPALFEAQRSKLISPDKALDQKFQHRPARNPVFGSGRNQ